MRKPSAYVSIRQHTSETDGLPEPIAHVRKPYVARELRLYVSLLGSSRPSSRPSVSLPPYVGLLGSTSARA